MPAITRAAFALADKNFTEWLYGEYSEEKLTQFELLYHIKPIGAYMDYKLDLRRDNEYLNRYGMDYSDIHDPRTLKQTSSGARMYGSSLNFVSKNLDKLYK